LGRIEVTCGPISFGLRIVRLWRRESKNYEVHEKYSPEDHQTRLEVETILYQLIAACPTDSAVEAMAQPGARDV